MILKKDILQVHMGKKKIPAQDYCPKTFTHVQWAGKKFWKDVSWVDTLNFISRLLKDFIIWTWVRGILCTIICPPQIAFSLHL